MVFFDLDHGKVHTNRLIILRVIDPVPKGTAVKTAEDAVAVAKAMTDLGIERIDASDLETLCKELRAANPKVVSDVQEGKQQAVGALIGQARKQNPNASPKLVREICLALIAAM